MSRFLLTLMVTPILTSCLDADAFLFNPRPLSRYTLPGNTIEPERLEPIETLSGKDRLYGYWIHAPQPSSITLLYYHGNRHNLDAYWSILNSLAKLPLNIIAFDYRGYGRSEGHSKNDQTLAEDAKAMLDFVLSKGIRPSELALYGYSLGAHAALTVATTTPFRRVIIEGAFSSLQELAESGLLSPFGRGWINATHFDNKALIAKVLSPIHMLHGRWDATAPLKTHGEVLYTLAPQPKELKVVDAAHSGLIESIGEEAYLSTITQWLDLPSDP